MEEKEKDEAVVIPINQGTVDSFTLIDEQQLE